MVRDSKSGGRISHVRVCVQFHNVCHGDAFQFGPDFNIESGDDHGSGRAIAGTMVFFNLIQREYVDRCLWLEFIGHHGAGAYADVRYGRATWRRQRHISLESDGAIFRILYVGDFLHRCGHESKGGIQREIK